MKKILPILLLISCLIWSCKPGNSSENTETATDTISQESEGNSQETTELKGVVLAKSGITVRKSPNRESEKVAGLKQHDEVNVLDMNGPHETIEGMDSPWLEIKTKDGVEGWVFGGFIGIPDHAPHCWCNAKQAFVSRYQDSGEGNPTEFDQGATYAGKQKLPCFIDAEAFGLDHTSMGYKISASGKWMAVDNGTDLWGALAIVNLSVGEEVKSFSYDRTLNDWEGETIRFWQNTGEIAERPEGSEWPDWVKVEEVLFQDGKEVHTGKFMPMETN
ncbi:MAG: SH3 domain-containing protein [Bacteroidia bacterium]|nr:SH3 domain-containing protein [Bacteroidia bacterium]